MCFFCEGSTFSSFEVKYSSYVEERLHFAICRLVVSDVFKLDFLELGTSVLYAIIYNFRN